MKTTKKLNLKKVAVSVLTLTSIAELQGGTAYYTNECIPDNFPGTAESDGCGITIDGCNPRPRGGNQTMWICEPNNSCECEG